MSDQKCPKTGPRRYQTSLGALGARLAGPETCRSRPGTIEGLRGTPAPPGAPPTSPSTVIMVFRPRFAVKSGGARNERHTLNT